ncbi:MAG: tyrosine--tRNA ligase, partial [Duodenibacillus sp.]
GEKIPDKGLKLGAGTYVVQVGKRRWAKVTVK